MTRSPSPEQSGPKILSEVKWVVEDIEKFSSLDLSKSKQAAIILEGQLAKVHLILKAILNGN